MYGEYKLFYLFSARMWQKSLQIEFLLFLKLLKKTMF
jgi:hypothetical protein